MKKVTKLKDLGLFDNLGVNLNQRNFIRKLHLSLQKAYWTTNLVSELESKETFTILQKMR